MAGCSTAGEFLDAERYEGSLVIMGIHSPTINWQAAVLEDVRNFEPADGGELVEELLSLHNLERDELNSEKHFALILQDGLAMQEEKITAAVTTYLQGVPLLGGSAGDDLQFKQTTQIANGKAYSEAAVVILGESAHPFAIIKNQHYQPAGEDVIVTDSNPEKRNIKTLDGRPAAEVYAEMTGVGIEEINTFDFGKSPLIYREQGEIYVRSIQKVEKDGSLTFYCAVDQGLLLEKGERQEPLQELKKSFDTLQHKLGEIELVILFSCILCKAETESAEERQAWGTLLQHYAPNVIGFDTYGEQLNGLHINQTMVAIGFTK